MYRILIADDETIVLEALTFIIENAFSGRCEIATAKSGRTFIEKAESFKPDICFVDIQMPGINGIEAMKEVREADPGVIFIVVSAFNEFDYAKEAIDLRVLTYITKPIDREIIIQTMKQAMQQIDTRRDQRLKDLETKEKLKIVTPILENGLLYQMTNEFGSHETLNNYLTLLGIDVTAGNLMVLQFGDEGNNGELTNEIGVGVRLEGLYEKIRVVVLAYFDGVTGPLMGNTISVFLPFEEKKGQGVVPESYQETQIRKAKMLSRTLQTEYGLRVRIAFGAVREMADMSASYKEAMRALKYEKEEISYAKKSEEAKGFIRKACSFIEANYDKNISLDEVALHAGVSSHYLSRLFKKEIALGFVGYLTEVRIKAAKELLQMTDKSVKEIALLVGYPDQNYFSRIFKKQTGLSPTEFKEQETETHKRVKE